MTFNNWHEVLVEDCCCVQSGKDLKTKSTTKCFYNLYSILTFLLHSFKEIVVLVYLQICFWCKLCRCAEMSKTKFRIRKFYMALMPLNTICSLSIMMHCAYLCR